MDEYTREYLALFPQLWSRPRPRPTIVWDEEGDEGRGPNGEYVSLWAPAPLDAEGWRVIIAVSEEAADRDEYLVERELPASMVLEEVQYRAESLLAGV